MITLKISGNLMVSTVVSFRGVVSLTRLTGFLLSPSARASPRCSGSLGQGLIPSDIFDQEGGGKDEYCTVDKHHFATVGMTPSE